MEDHEFEDLLKIKANLQMLLNAKKRALQKTDKDFNKLLSPQIIYGNDTNYKHLEPEDIKNSLFKSTQAISDVRLENVKKNLLENNIYLYTADARTKALEFNLKLKIEIKDQLNFKMLQIWVNFPNIEKCYLFEINQCIHSFIKNNNISMVMSNIINYGQKSISRSIIIDELLKEDCISIKKCNDNGGWYIFVHSSQNKECIYFKFHWTLHFSQRYYCVLHYFYIENVGNEKIAADHIDLMDGFCNPKIDYPDLLNLWQKLCEAVKNEK